MVESFKSITDYLSNRTGVDLRIDRVKKWAARNQRDRLPIKRLRGRVLACTAELDEWLDRNVKAA